MHRPARSVAPILLLSLALFGCNGTDEATTTTVADADPAPSGEDGAPAAPEVMEGSVDDFYVVPDPLPEGKPGDLIRVQPVGERDGIVTVRVMYHSNDASGRDRAVTGIVSHPTGAAPDDGWPVISTAHGTTGVAGHCAPSRNGAPAPDWGVESVRVATDYVGMGPVGEIHPYLSKPSEGNAVIDGVIAARQLDGTNAGTRWISIGHSQGGHGSLSAHELAAERAPDLELVGTVALAPGVMLDKVYGGIDPIVTTILTMMAIHSGASEHPDVDPADYFTPEALAASAVFETGCLDEITEQLIPVAIAGPFTSDPRTTAPASELIAQNDVGDVTVDGVPVLVASGTLDDRVVIERVRDLFTRMCAAGQVTELHVIDGADHGSVIPATSDLVTEWIQARLAGAAPTDSCTPD